MIRKLAIAGAIVALGLAFAPAPASATHDANCPAGSVIAHIGNSTPFLYSHLSVDQCVQGGDAAQDFDGSFDTGAACVIDQAYSEGGADTFELFCATGTAAAPMFANAGPGGDTIDGSDGIDDLNGGSGNDTIRAGGGDDRVFDGSGVDVLKGQAGSDDLLCFAPDGNLDERDAQGFETVLPISDAVCS